MNWVILAGYVVLCGALRKGYVVSCLLAFCVVAAIQLYYPSEVTSYQVAFSFVISSCIYAILACYLHKKNLLIAMFAACCIASYDLFFASDTFVNYEVETWVYRNHEGIITVLHAALMCVCIPKFNTIFYRCWHNSFRVFNRVLHIQPFSGCCKRAQNREGFK